MDEKPGLGLANAATRRWEGAQASSHFRSPNSPRYQHVAVARRVEERMLHSRAEAWALASHMKMDITAFQGPFLVHTLCEEKREERRGGEARRGGGGQWR